jgi:hypothetical protein
LRTGTLDLFPQPLQNSGGFRRLRFCHIDSTILGRGDANFGLNKLSANRGVEGISGPGLFLQTPVLS